MRRHIKEVTILLRLRFYDDETEVELQEEPADRDDDLQDMLDDYD
jgi:hypothetical protein